MIEIQRQQNNPITIIRSACERELTQYEKDKLSTAELGAQRNRIETIEVNGQEAPIDPRTKVAQINLGNLAFNNKVSPEDLDPSECFIISCELE